MSHICEGCAAAGSDDRTAVTNDTTPFWLVVNDLPHEGEEDVELGVPETRQLM